jgi:hypothetical protein
MDLSWCEQMQDFHVAISKSDYRFKAEARSTLCYLSIIPEGQEV